MTVGFATLAGNDDFAKIALGYLAEQGVELGGVRHADDPSSVTVLINHGTVRHILTYPGTTPLLTARHLDLDYLCAARHFHVSSLFLLKGLRAGLPDLFKAVKARGLTISLDTNDDPDDRWEGVLDELLPLVDVFLPNERELLRITKAANLDEALALAARKVKLIVVKRGAEGALLQKGAERLAVAGKSVEPVDAIGAGDSFNAGFLLGYVRGLPPEECAAIGNVTGAISTQRPGGVEAFRDKAFLRKSLAALAPELKWSALLAGG